MRCQGIGRDGLVLGYFLKADGEDVGIQASGGRDKQKDCYHRREMCFRVVCLVVFRQVYGVRVLVLHPTTPRLDPTTTRVHWSCIRGMLFRDV